ncbi:hypothetical protein D7V80_33555 [Corallococcus sp. CA054B]|uniref:hypothetical protein n=1 Tax=Corallococcus sp. CA054B TaxID=2316734 RepID=UPI000EA1DE1D|nr:hypothetical protein [Corallococcus sp. CA054B]RKG61678.1 hypothetical protein D7V80_33555 [Corallococcus sp. CA054B]
MAVPIPSLYIENVIREIALSRRLFDTHDVIKRLMARYPARYKTALAACGAKRNPLHSLHTQLGRAIAEICLRLGYHPRQSRSKDIHDRNSRCLSWS